MIDWTCRKGVRAALEHHFDAHKDFEGLDYHNRVKLLCAQFSPTEARPVLQGILTDAGKDWRTIKLINSKSIKALAPEFANACIDIINARTELLESASRSVPQKIVFKKEKVEQSEESYQFFLQIVNTFHNTVIMKKVIDLSVKNGTDDSEEDEEVKEEEEEDDTEEEEVEEKEGGGRDGYRL